MNYTWARILYMPKYILFVSCEYSRIFLGNGTKCEVGNQSQHDLFPRNSSRCLLSMEVEALIQVNVSIPKGRRNGLASTFQLGLLG